MCGIVGVISKSYNGLTLKEKDVFDELLYIDALRGEDSTGVMAVDNDGNLDLAKEASIAGYYQASDEYKQLMRDSVRAGAALIGHNRKATKGNIVDENAHPFVVDDRIVLVHNGTLYGDHTKIANTEVDSHAIAHLIHEKGDDVEAALSELNGAYALVWYDVTNKTMNFVRNSQRPLAFLETHSGWFWASEPGMLAWIIARNQLTPVTGSKIEMLPEGELHSFRRQDRTWIRTTRKLNLVKQVDYDYGDWPNYTTQRQGFHRDACAYSGDSALRKTSDWTSPPAGSTPTGGTVLTLPHTPVAERTDGPHRLTVKTRDGEAELARKGGFVTDVDRFQEACGGYSANNWISGSIFDYDYVRGDTASAGLFVYARMWDHPDVLIRCYVPLEKGDTRKSIEDFELLIIGMQLSEAKMAFKIAYKSWHRFTDGGPKGEGFSVIYCTEMAPLQIKELPNVTEETA